MLMRWGNKFLARTTICVEFAHSPPPYLCGFSTDTLVFSHIPKMCMWYELVWLSCPTVSTWGCVRVDLLMEMMPVQGWVLTCSLSCRHRLQTPATISWNEWVGKSLHFLFLFISLKCMWTYLMNSSYLFI